MIKKLFLACLVLFALVQLIPKPKKNTSTVVSIYDISSKCTDSTVLNILKRSCYDCHSNHTNYRWYYSLQPVALWMNNHIEEGKMELNFSEFLSYSPKKQKRKLEEIAEQVEENEMPIKSYTLAHRSAQLSADEKKIIIKWAKTDLF